MEKTKSAWIPKTELGRKVMNGELTAIEEIFEKGYIIREPEIVDALVPNLENYLIHTGGMPGKGGGKMRTPVRITTRMHKSGRRRTLHALIIIGNRNGLLGMGYATGQDAQRAIQKAERYAKLSIIPVKRGCGSWECGCGGAHSLPFKVHGRNGSVNIELLPAPRGLGLCVPHEIKKIMQLAGLSDVWMRSYGNTSSRLNFVIAVFSALSTINKMRMPEVAGVANAEVVPKAQVPEAAPAKAEKEEAKPEKEEAKEKKAKAKAEGEEKEKKSGESKEKPKKKAKAKKEDAEGVKSESKSE